MQRRHSILIIAALALVALAATACSKTETNTNNSNTTTNTSTNTTSNKTTNTTATPVPSSTSPEAALKASFDAARRKDVATFKNSIASADLKEMEEMMKKGGKNLDEFLKEMLENPDEPMPPSLETRNEKIDGDKATVEYKSLKGNWKTANLIKESGGWKIKLNNGPAEEPAAKKETDDTGNDEHEKGEH